MPKKSHICPQPAELVTEADSKADHALFVKAVQEEEEVKEQYISGCQGQSELTLDHLTEDQRQELLAYLISSS